MGMEAEAEAHYCIGYQLPAPSDLQTTGTWQHELWQLDLFLLKPAILSLILPNSSVAQLNPSSVGQPEKHSAINSFILDHNVDIFCITESWLHPSGDEAKCADLASPDTCDLSHLTNMPQPPSTRSPPSLPCCGLLPWDHAFWTPSKNGGEQKGSGSSQDCRLINRFSMPLTNSLTVSYIRLTFCFIALRFWPVHLPNNCSALLSTWYSKIHTSDRSCLFLSENFLSDFPISFTAKLPPFTSL